MAQENQLDDSPQNTDADVTDTAEGETDAAIAPSSTPTPTSTSSQPPVAAAPALRDGTAPEALCKLVLQRASAAADARDIVAALPSPALPKSAESPIVAAAKKAAPAARRG
jgi:hypothetical protein